MMKGTTSSLFLFVCLFVVCVCVCIGVHVFHSISDIGVCVRECGLLESAGICG
eukprot:m.11658 g.11658  ORF g.11658 m.11658 type:complete len:53 (+) comp5754_c1_seq1:298-456(+)